MTIHRYPLRNCFVAPQLAAVPDGAQPAVELRDRPAWRTACKPLGAGRPRRSTASCDSTSSTRSPAAASSGVSDTFASSLWVVDALFELARLGVDGVNMHTLPRSAYELFEFSRVGRALARLGAAGLLRAAAVRAGGAARRRGC